MIRTKSIYAAKEKSDGIRILITRHYPRGIRKEHFNEWCRDLSPSASLLKWYRNDGMSWNDFMVRFKMELNNSKSLETIDRLHTESMHSDITLLCYERNEEPCHRHLLREIIAKPRMLKISFVPEYTDYHERRSVARHVSHQKSCIIP